MGMKRKIATLVLALGGLALVAACEAAPPPPTTPPKTPPVLISNAEYDAIVEGMAVVDVEWALQKPLTFESESSYTGSTGTYVTRYYSYDAEFGDCWQRTSYVFDNTDEDFDIVPGPLRLSSKHRSEYDCEGIVK
jgi:hypothetical protein